MSEYAAFLRGMNVGGHRISNEDLRARFEELGFGEVRTFRASGNVIFAAAGEESEDELSARKSKRAWRPRSATRCPSSCAPPSEIGTIAAHRPFAESLVEASKGKLQVVLLSRRVPRRGRARRCWRWPTTEDRLAFGERELHWLPSGGILDSALDFKAIGRLLGPITTRTKGTIEQLAAKYFAD